MAFRITALRMTRLISRQSVQFRAFSQSNRLLVNPLANLSHFSAAKEAQFLSKERKLPREEFHPHLQLIRSSEVDVFAPAPGASPEVIAKLKEAANGQSDAETTYKLAITNLASQLTASRLEVSDLKQARHRLSGEYERLRALTALTWIVIGISLPMLAFYFGQDRSVDDVKRVGRRVEHIGSADGTVIPISHQPEQSPAKQPESSIKLDDLAQIIVVTLNTLTTHLPGYSQSSWDVKSMDEIYQIQGHYAHWQPAMKQIYDNVLEAARKKAEGGTFVLNPSTERTFADLCKIEYSTHNVNDELRQRLQVLGKQQGNVQKIAASFLQLSAVQQSRLVDDVLSVLYPQFCKTRPRSFLSRCFWAGPSTPADRGLLVEELKGLK